MRHEQDSTSSNTDYNIRMCKILRKSDTRFLLGSYEIYEYCKFGRFVGRHKKEWSDIQHLPNKS